MRTTAVVPVYNEKPEVLTSVLNDLKKYVTDIVVVDDGSSFPIDCHLPAVKFLRHQINRGQGAALQTGTDWAVAYGADIILHFDADGQHCAADIPDLIRPLINNQADFVFGSRFLGKKIFLPERELAPLVADPSFRSRVQVGFRSWSPS